MRISGIKVNYDSIKKRIMSLETASSPALMAAAARKANKAFLVAKQKMLADFDKHPVTKEISAGPDGANISFTLGGYGNLFSFIGFYEGDNPTADLRTVLQTYTNIGKPIPRRGGFWSFNISLPNKSVIEGSTKMPWSSESWATAIENYISGVGYYINIDSPFSRSGEGVQAKSQVSSGNFRAVQYLSQIFDKFKLNLSTK